MPCGHTFILPRCPAQLLEHSGHAMRDWGKDQRESEQVEASLSTLVLSLSLSLSLTHTHTHTHTQDSSRGKATKKGVQSSRESKYPVSSFFPSHFIIFFIVVK